MAVHKGGTSLIFIKPGGLDNIDNHGNIADVAAIYEIGLVKFIMDGVAAVLRVGPGADLLGKAAVIGMAALAIRQAFRLHQAFHAGVLGLDFFRSAIE